MTKLSNHILKWHFPDSPLFSKLVAFLVLLMRLHASRHRPSETYSLQGDKEGSHRIHCSQKLTYKYLFDLNKILVTVAVEHNITCICILIGVELFYNIV